MIALLLFCILPHDSAARDTFDVIEVQAMWQWSGCEQENGDVDYHLKPVFCQLLFRRWDRDRCEHVIEAWRMAKPTMQYGYVHSRGVHEIRWCDGEIERVVQAKAMKYTAADFDSEVIERTQYPREWRTDLRRK